MKKMTLKEIQEALGYEVEIVPESAKCKNVDIGEITNIAGVEWIMLDKVDDKVVCITKDLIRQNIMFDSASNNYANSHIRKILNDKFLEQLVQKIDKNHILDAEIDLISLDGLNAYENITDKIGLLTFDMYRKYSQIIEKYPTDKPWWLATAWSMQYREYGDFVCSIDKNNAIVEELVNARIGLRPVCIFSTSVFES